MATALLIPSESPPSVDDVKQALLTFEHVRLLSPDERGLVPDIAAFQAISPVPLPVGMNLAPLRPLGKVPGYDGAFENLMETLIPAVRQNLVIFDAAPERHGMVIGSIPVPQDTPNPRAIYQIYASIASSPNILDLVASDLPDSVLMAHAGDLAPQSIDATDLRLILGDEFGNATDLVRAETSLSLARIAAVVRSVAQAHLAGAVPLTSDRGQGLLLRHMTTSLETVVNEANDESEEMLALRRLARLHNLLVEERLDSAALHGMSIPEVISLRTRAWGDAGEARSRMNITLREIALNEPTPDRFDRAVNREIDAYLEARSDLDHEARKFGVRALAGSLGALSAAGAGSSVYHSLFGMGSLEAVLLVTGLLAGGVKDYVPIVMDLMRQDMKVKESSGYSILGPYRELLR